MANYVKGGSAVIEIATTLREGTSQSSKKIGVMSAGDKVTVLRYNKTNWYCKVKHSKLGTGWCLYMINGSIHVSGKGVTEAYKAQGGVKGDPTTGFQLRTFNASSIKATGTVVKKVTVWKTRESKTSLGTIPVNTIVSMSKVGITDGWCYVEYSSKKPTMQNPTPKKDKHGYVCYKTTSNTYIKATDVKSGDAKVSEINNNSIVKHKNSSGNGGSGGSGDSGEGGDGEDSSVSTDKFIPEDDSLTRDDIDYAAFQGKLNDYDQDSIPSDIVRGIHGMPYQFSSLVDPKLSSDSSYGRLYAERILSKMPLLVLSPGIPTYMPNYSNDSKDDLLSALVAGGISAAETLLADVSGEEGDGKFYTFQHAYSEYFNYVDAMLQEMAIYLGIANKYIYTTRALFDKSSLGQMSWENYQSRYLKNISGLVQAVGFYVDAESQMSESFSNSTAESEFANSINQVNNLSREIGFLMGGATGTAYNQLLTNNFSDAFDQITSFTDKYIQVLPALLTSRLRNTLDTIKVGGQLVFPEIWNDSDFSRSYDINIKLRTPDGDPYSWYLNIGVPLIHLLAFTLPRQLGYNGIQSPFLVRAFYKGQFNVNMGIISSLSITRGEKSKWTLSALPLDVDISISIKDLYQSLSMSPKNDYVGLSKNVDQLDYIANLCGINVNKPDIMRAIELDLNRLWSAGKKTLFGNGLVGLQVKVDSLGENLYHKLLPSQ